MIKWLLHKQQPFFFIGRRIKMGHKILIVGGTWDNNGGKSSSFVNKLAEALWECEHNFTWICNGGNYSKLQSILEESVDYNTVIWLANVSNDLDKLRDVKSYNPRAMFINSKRNDGGKYSFQELIARSLEQKANLTLEFRKGEDGIIQTRIFDPLGTIWSDFTSDLDKTAKNLLDRLAFLRCVTREGVRMTDEDFGKVDMPDEVFEKFKSFGQVFHDLIKPEEGTKRFLGNMSFRCLKGFPSFRQGETIFVSRRNVDKQYISKEDFVPVRLSENGVVASGKIKPSVDTPVQARLYKIFPQVNFMLHAHVYVEGAPFTKMAVPCGALEEINEIMDLANHYNFSDNFSMNLIGHGCLICAKDFEYFDSLTFVGRPIPEILFDTLERKYNE
jgi:hypothetical protein